MKRKQGFVYDTNKIKTCASVSIVVCPSDLSHESSPHLRPLFRDDGIVDVYQALALQSKQVNRDGEDITKYSP